jgi:hypothetical protein
MSDVEIETLLTPHSKELASIAEAVAKGERGKVVDQVASLVATLATGNPLLGALAPLARKGVAAAFGNAADEMFRRELAALEKDEEKKRFLDQIDEVVAALVGQALVQLVRSQHAVKDEVLQALGGVRADFERFRQDFVEKIGEKDATIHVDAMRVSQGAVGIRVRSSTTRRVRLQHLAVSGAGSVGIVLDD